MPQPRSLFHRPGPVRAARPTAAAGAVEFLLYDEIQPKAIAEFWGIGISVHDVAEFLGTVNGGVVNLRINSPGGDVFEGVAMFNQFRQWAVRTGGRVVVHVDGLAASIASVVALAGDEVRIAPNGFFMIHNASTIAWGDADLFRKVADDLEKITRGAITDTYARKTGQEQAQLEAWMTAETWFTAAEAVEAGFADAVEEEVPEEAAAEARAFDLRAYQHVPAALRDAPPAEPRVRKAERALREAGFSRKAAMAGASAAERAIVGQREAGDGAAGRVLPFQRDAGAETPAAEVRGLRTTIERVTWTKS